MEPERNENTIPMKAILKYISLELNFIAAENETLQETLHSLLTGLSIDLESIKKIQSLDLLSQKKRDIATLVAFLSDHASTEPQVNECDIHNSLKLDYLRTVLTKGGSSEDNILLDPDRGTVNLF